MKPSSLDAVAPQQLPDDITARELALIGVTPEEIPHAFVQTQGHGLCCDYLIRQLINKSLGRRGGVGGENEQPMTGPFQAHVQPCPVGPSGSGLRHSLPGPACPRVPDARGSVPTLEAPVVRLSLARGLASSSSSSGGSGVSLGEGALARAGLRETQPASHEGRAGADGVHLLGAELLTDSIGPSAERPPRQRRDLPLGGPKWRESSLRREALGASLGSSTRRRQSTCLGGARGALSAGRESATDSLHSG